MYELDKLELGLGSAGKSYQRVIEFLYVGRMLRYFTVKQIQDVYSGFNKIVNRKKISRFVEEGYLRKHGQDVYSVSNKPYPLFDEVGLNTSILTYGKAITGEGKSNEILNTSILVNLMKDEYFFHFFSLQFPRGENAYIKPDMLMVLYDPITKRYMLKFIEIENTEKVNWKEYVEDKVRRYKRLGSENVALTAWSVLAKKLNFRPPDSSEFGFNVLFIGDMPLKLEGDYFESKRI